ncbi:YcxB family protein [Streptomyces sp. NPDC096079]|uniref:YcxB family protein n=1 Tax=unclassified Streptomyces TaxID=2593676 RepID=UPI00331E05FB
MGERLEIVYSAEFAEVKEAVRVRLRSTRWWRFFRWATRGVCALAFLVAGAGLVAGEVAGPVKLVLLGAVAVACAELVPWLSARSLFRLIGSQGEARAVVDEDGGRWISRDTDMTIRWALLTRYAETPRLFVLFTHRSSGTGFAYLPKRGLAGPADEGRLRAILDRNAIRV